MGGNIPGGDFLGGNFPGTGFSRRGSLIGGNFPGGNFPGRKFRRTTKNILVDSWKLKCQEKVIQNFSGLTMIRSYMEATQNLKVEKDYKGLNWKLTLGLTLTVCSHKIWNERCDILNFFSVSQESCFHSWNHSIILNYDVLLPRNEVVSICSPSSHFAFWSQSS